MANSFGFPLRRYSQSIARISVLVLFVLWLTGPAHAYMKAYLPLTEPELSRRVRQRHIPVRFEPGAVTGFGTAVIRLNDDGVLVVSGTDRQSKPWTCYARWSLGGAFYSADLDNNGTSDLIFASYTGGNGLAPPMHVMALLLDASGRPVPSQMDGYFEIDKAGLMDFVDLDRDGRAELVRQSYDDGYWITSLYEARDGLWTLIRGQHAGRSFPMYTRFTYRANRTPVTPAPGRRPVEDDLSNSALHRTTSVELTALRWSDVRQSESPVLSFSDNRRCTPIAWYSTMAVVIDGPNGRQASILQAEEHAHQMLELIRREALPVRSLGNRRPRDVTGEGPGACRLELVWADAPLAWKPSAQ